ncbi:fungal-specific transcription factor domain-containing protein [Lipomyces starkeyi]
MAPKIRFVVDGSPESLDDRPHTAGDKLSNVIHRQRRVSRACMRCKRRKIRCSGTQPCQVCSVRNIECVYKDGRALANPASKRQMRDNSMSTTNSTINHIISNEPTGSGVELEVITWKASSTEPNDRLLTAKCNLSPNSGDILVRSKQKDEEYPDAAAESYNQGVLIRQPYLRWLGPTSVAPPLAGIFRLLSVNVSTSGAERPVSSSKSSNNVVLDCHEFTLRTVPEDHETDSLASSLSPATNTRSPPTAGVELRGWTADRTASKMCIPSKERIDTFYEHMASYLPFLRRKDLDDRISDGVAGESLLFAMAAIAERLKPSHSCLNGEDLSEMYGEQAKALLIPHLALPSVETVFSLLLIAYLEFAEDRDSGLWSWSGLAIRMSYDLGLHKSFDGIGDEEQIAQRRRVFWSVVCLDRFISCGTGRIATIPIDHIDHQVDDVTTGEVIHASDGNPLTDPFPYLCRLVLLLGKVSDILNRDAGKKQRRPNSTFESSSSSDPATDNDIQAALCSFQKEIFDFQAFLPADLIFDVHNFQAFEHTKHAQCFLLLHAWIHAIILAVYHPKLVYPRSALDIPGWLSNPNADLSRTSAISIADIIVFADLIAPDAFLSNPFMCQPLLMAGSASLTLWHSLSLASPSTDHAVSATVYRAFSACQDGLRRLQKRWKGVSWLCHTLDSLEKFEPDVDLTRVTGSKIKTKDMGFVKRASIDDATRQWIADELRRESVFGVVIAGMTTETPGPISPRRVTRAQKTQENFAVPSIWSFLKDGAPLVEEYDVYAGTSLSSLTPPQRQQQMCTPDVTLQCWGTEDPSKNMPSGI